MFSYKNRNQLPSELKSAGDFFSYLKIGDKEMKYYFSHIRRSYSTLEIPKRRGGPRVLDVPNDRLKYIQRQILRKLEEIYVPRKSVHGFVKNRGILTNGAAHQKRPFLLNIDLLDFFGTISYNRVAGVLRSFGIDREIITTICALTIFNNRLPQGAPTSPILANMVSFKLDVDLHRYAKKNNLRYTRFADDITFSAFIQPKCLFEGGILKSGKLIDTDLSPELVNIININGFKINPVKSWFSDRRLRKEVTGLTVNEFPNVPRKFIRNIRSTLYKISVNGLENAQGEFTEKYHPKRELKKVIRGKIEWVGHIKGRSDPVYRTLADKFNALFPKSALKIEPTYEEIIDRSIWILQWCEDIDGEAITSQGTAFFLKGIGLVTAHHVMEGLPTGLRAEIFHPSDVNQKFSAWINGVQCSHVDVAKLNHNIPNTSYLELPSSLGGFSKRDNVCAHGFPSYNIGDELTELDGKILSVSTISAVERISVSSVLNPGISGGPVLDSRFHVIGMVHKGGQAEAKQLVTSINDIVKLCGKSN